MSRPAPHRGRIAISLLIAGAAAGVWGEGLVTHVADAADRRGLPLWVPNVGGKVLRYSLRLPGTLWVDGPAVPR